MHGQPKPHGHASPAFIGVVGRLGDGDTDGTLAPPSKRQSTGWLSARVPASHTTKSPLARSEYMCPNAPNRSSTTSPVFNGKSLSSQRSVPYQAHP